MADETAQLPDSAFYKTIVDGLYEGVYFVDLERKITYWNSGAERITGYYSAEVVGHSCADNILVHIDESGNSLCTACCPLTATIMQGCSHTHNQIYLHHKDGHRVPVDVSVSLIRDPAGNAIGAVEIFTERNNLDFNLRLIEDLKREALLDQLTGLPNRRYLELNLTGSLAEFDRHQVGFGLMFIDVDHFKQFNDTFGHCVGDQVLRLVCNTMENCMRPYDMIGRWGGEEFVAIIRFVDSEQFHAVAEKLRTMVQHSFLTHDGTQLSVTVTIGGTHVETGDTQDSLLRRADQLMYEGKQAGRNLVVIG
jgi:diguanylate cyclase (GGDEF)-like protein/PAS domain S-box-containing protein